MNPFMKSNQRKLDKIFNREVCVKEYRAPDAAKAFTDRREVNTKRGDQNIVLFSPGNVSKFISS